MNRDECFLFQRLPSVLYGRVIAGGVGPGRRVTVRRRAAIGDVVAATCVADKLAEQGYAVTFQSEQAIHCVLKRHPTIDLVATPDTLADVVLDGVYEQSPQRRVRSFGMFFVEAANQQLQRRGIHLGKPLNCTPRLVIQEHVRLAVLSRFSVHPRPWVFICPRSHAWMNRTILDDTWQAAAKLIPGTKFWIGLHPAPPGIVDLHCRHIASLLDWLPVADLLVTVDTGPMHLAAAFGVPVVAILQASSPDLHLSDQNDFIVIAPHGLDCLNCQKNICPINAEIPPCQSIEPERIAEAVNAKLDGMAGKVSACVAIYQPKAAVLNRCLECLLPQVDEIVVSVDQAGVIPDGAKRGHRIRYIRKNVSGIGYGRNMNHATRFSFGRYVLHCNDDVFLAPDAVAKMRECMRPGVGIVSALLRKPDGRIQHAGKLRRPHERGWYHLDYDQVEATIKEPVEAENTCGACWLVDRSAHFLIQGYDERFYLYAEDDDYCLRMRQAGKRIMYQPQATGVHLEHQSTSMAGSLPQHLHNSNKLFDQLWGRYLTHNADRVPGNFEY